MKPSERYDSLFQYYGVVYGVDPWLLKAQVAAESNFDPDAKSRVGAMGLAQFMPATWAELAMKKGWVSAKSLIDPRDPEDAIRAQSVYMTWLIKTCGDIKLALAAYNAGIGRVTRIFLNHGLTWEMGAPQLPTETQAYVPKVMWQWRQYVQPASVALEHPNRR